MGRMAGTRCCTPLKIIIISLVAMMPNGDAFTIAHGDASRTGTMDVILVAMTKTICRKWIVCTATDRAIKFIMVTLAICAEVMQFCSPAYQDSLESLRCADVVTSLLQDGHIFCIPLFRCRHTGRGGKAEAEGHDLLFADMALTVYV